MLWKYLLFSPTWILQILQVQPLSFFSCSFNSGFSVVFTMTSTEAGMGQSTEPKKRIASANNVARASPSMFRRWGRSHPFIRYGLPMISLTVLGAVGLGHLLQGRLVVASTVWSLRFKVIVLSYLGVQFNLLYLLSKWRNISPQDCDRQM